MKYWESCFPTGNNKLWLFGGKFHTVNMCSCRVGFVSVNHFVCVVYVLVILKINSDMTHSWEVTEIFWPG